MGQNTALLSDCIVRVETISRVQMWTRSKNLGSQEWVKSDQRENTSNARTTKFDLESA